MRSPEEKEPSEYPGIYKEFDHKQRLLWLSDIHYVVDYKEGKNGLSDFRTSFFKKCAAINAELPINIVLISGDIAQYGTRAEYDQFYEDILVPLFKELPDAKLLVVPGNHDVNQKYIEYFESYLTSNDGNKIDLNFIKDTEVEKVFEDYRAFFADHLELFPDGGKTLSAAYRGSFYQGYYRDDANKFLYVLGNSSWLSFGTKSMSYYIEKYLEKNLFPGAGPAGRKKRMDEADRKKHINNIESFAFEYGRQTLAIKHTFEEFKTIKKRYKEYDEYFKIFVVHHPENWLTWEERTDPDSSYAFLKKQSNVVCTGHEHVRHNYTQENRNKTNLHLKAGAFIEYENKTCKLDQSLFTILDINGTKKSVSEKKYYYDVNQLGAASGPWTPKGRENYSLEKPTNTLYFKNRIKKVKTKVNQEPKDVLRAYFSDFNLEEIKIKEAMLDKKTKRLFFYVEHLDIYLKTNKPLVTRLHKAILANEIKEIFFITIDIMIQGEEAYDKREDRMEVLQEIKDTVDRAFTTFRNRFLKDVSSEQLAETRMASVLLPFWKLES